MKIVLINPPFSCATPLSLGFGEPLGLAYVAAAVEASGRHHVEVIDGIGLADAFTDDILQRDTLIRHEDSFWVGLPREDILSRLDALDFDAVGITMVRLHEGQVEAAPLAAAIRACYPKVPIIVGGPEASMRAAQYIRDPNFDFVVIGEGEATIIDLLDHLDGRIPRDQLRGLAYRDESGQPVMAPPQRIVDIDSIPWPARHLLPMDTYLRHKLHYTRPPTLNILTSRACPFNCPFCGSVPVWGRRWRGRKPKDVVDEMAFLVERYGAGEIRIQDDNFAVDRQRAEAICDGIVERGLNIALHIEPGLMIHLATKTLLDKMRAAGIVGINMQLESGLQKTQEYLNKKIDMDHAKEMVSHAHSLGMQVGTNIIIGFYFETVEDMRKSVENALEIGYDSITFLYPYAMPDTKLRADCLAHGVLDENAPPVYPLPTQHASAEEVQQTLVWANEEFRKRKFHPEPLLGRSWVLAAAEMEHRGGHCWRIALPADVPGGDTAERWGASQVRLFEDGRELGPAHNLFTRIKEFGRGRFSHRPGLLLFSSSDSQDPQSNGRTYVLHY